MFDKIKFKNLESNKEIEFKLGKKATFIYGKNGSGKTTISRSDFFDKNFVFNQDFISKNVFSVDEKGAKQSSENKENFSGLWLSEEIVNLRIKFEKIDNVLYELNKKINSLKNKIVDDFYQSNIVGLNEVNIDSDIKNFINLNFKINIDNIDNIENLSKLSFEYQPISIIKTSIKNDQELQIESSKLKNDILLQKFFIDIENSKLLNELIFLNEYNFINEINDNISLLSKKKNDLERIEFFSKGKKISEELLDLIKEWLNKNKDATKCFFCNENIDKIKDEWINYFNNDILNKKEEIFKTIRKEIELIKKIIENKKEYEKIEKEVLSFIFYIYEYLLKFIESIKNNSFDLLNFKNIRNIKKPLLDKKIIFENIKHYIYKKNLKEIEFYNNCLFLFSDEKIKKQDELNSKMETYGEKIKTNINNCLNKFNFNKKITINIDNKSKIKKFNFKIQGHKNIKELSDGQKQKIALAIFFSSILDKTTIESQDSLVIDDPVISLDLEGYLFFKFFLINEIAKNRKQMQLLILTHNFDYLYIQISNLTNRNSEDFKVYKLSNSNIIEYPIKYFDYDDISLFQNCLFHLKSKGELYQLFKFTFRVYRFFSYIYCLLNNISQKNFFNEYKKYRNFFLFY